MYVLADVEWVENDTGLISFTQISMTRVDEKWKVVRGISRRIRPKDTSFHRWNHIAFTGGSEEVFMAAPCYSQAFEDIETWLWPSDTIVWWSNESMEWVQKIVPSITNPQIVINERVANYLGHKLCNPYQLGKKLNLTPPGAMHNARNDVDMMRMVLEAIQFPNPIPDHIELAAEDAFAPKIPDYIAHVDTNIIHKKGCPKLPADGRQRGYDKLSKPIGKGYIPCDCVKEEYRKARRIRNQNIIDRTEYCFIYSPDSRVFHRRDCKIALNAKHIMGTVQYHNCLATGRQPCKVCNPQYADESYQYVLSGKKGDSKRVPAPSVSEKEQRAIKRHRQAVEERQAYKERGALRQEGKDDLYTLTQPRFAFWAAAGYNTFHLRNCKKMAGLSNLRGFSLHSDAMAAGYRPCKCCKPTPKHDIHLSMPIYSRKRIGESVDMLVAACKANSYEYSQEGGQFTLETPVGIWKINTTNSPYRLHHINTAMTPDNRTNFHRQPRIFYSLQDTISYIKRHDDAIIMHSIVGSA